MEECLGIQNEVGTDFSPTYLTTINVMLMDSDDFGKVLTVEVYYGGLQTEGTMESNTYIIKDKKFVYYYYTTYASYTVSHYLYDDNGQCKEYENLYAEIIDSEKLTLAAVGIDENSRFDIFEYNCTYVDYDDVNTKMYTLLTDYTGIRDKVK